MNMPIEMGMALFHALHTQRREHRCVFFVPTAHDYQAFASDLAGLDPRVHNNDDTQILTDMYEWLRGVVPAALFNPQPTIDVLEKFVEFKFKERPCKRRWKGRGAVSRGDLRWTPNVRQPEPLLKV
jgi:hypothetical protein